MAGDLPPLYFRLRENGATCFRVATRDGRLELDPLAQINLRKGEVRPQGDRTVSEEEHAEIAAWIAARAEGAAARDSAAVAEAVAQLNALAHWAQTQATDAQLESVTDPLLLAMHDLRSVLARKQAERLTDSAPRPGVTPGARTAPSSGARRS